MPDFQMSIRAATVDDAAALAYVQAVSQAPSQGVNWNTIPEDRRAFALHQETTLWQYAFLSPESSIPGRGEFILVAEDAPRRVVGYIWAGPSGNTAEGELYHLFVLPDAQRQGVGRALVRAVAQRLREQGFQSLRVYAEKPMQTYYEQTLKGTYVGEGPGIREPTRRYRWDDLSRLI